MITITLPFPKSELSPNSRLHWAIKSAAVKEARDLAKLETLNQIPPSKRRLHRAKKYVVTISFAAPDNKPRDLDNLHARMKSALDGICDVLQINDRQFKRITVQWLEPAPVSRGLVIVQIEPLSSRAERTSCAQSRDTSH